MPETSTELFGSDDGTFTVEPGSIRLIAVDVEGRLLLIVGSVWPEPRDNQVDRLIDGVIRVGSLRGGRPLRHRVTEAGARLGHVLIDHPSMPPWIEQAKAVSPSGTVSVAVVTAPSSIGPSRSRTRP